MKFLGQQKHKKGLTASGFRSSNDIQEEKSAKQTISTLLYHKPSTRGGNSVNEQTQTMHQKLVKRELPTAMCVAEFPTSSESGYGHPVEEDKPDFWGGNDDKSWNHKQGAEYGRKTHRARDIELYTVMGREQVSPQKLQKSKGLTHMIGYLTSTASEDTSIVLKVCEQASSSESNAKEAIRALRREFKYGKPLAQLSAARLWAIMLRNSSDTFISQSTAPKFLDTLENLLQCSQTSPVVRERLLEVIAAAAYASCANKDTGFKRLWQRVKPHDKPDEGIPFDMDDPIMIVDLMMSQHPSGSEVLIIGADPHPDEDTNPPPLSMDAAIPAATAPFSQPDSHLETQPPTGAHELKEEDTSSGASSHIIPRDEEIRRLFRECNIEQGNAALLAQLVALDRPEDIERQNRIKQFLAKCRSSQELAVSSVPSVERTSADVNRLTMEDSRGDSAHAGMRGGAPETGHRGAPPADGDEVLEKQLLSALRHSNKELAHALKQHDDLARIARERKAEIRSRKEARNRASKQHQQLSV